MGDGRQHAAAVALAMGMVTPPDGWVSAAILEGACESRPCLYVTEGGWPCELFFKRFEGLIDVCTAIY